MNVDGGQKMLYEYLDFDPTDPCDGCPCLVDGFCICVDGCANEWFPALPEPENRIVGSDSAISDDNLIVPNISVG